MNHCWNNVMLPIIQAVNGDYIVELGFNSDITTRNILDYCCDNDGHMTIVDSSHKFAIDKFKVEYRNKFEICTDPILNRLALLKDYDVILINVDHNSILYKELKIIEKSFHYNNLPIIFLHKIHRNGIISAVQDFIDESKIELSFEVINDGCGLGILFKNDYEIEKTIKKVIKSSNLLDNIDDERIKIGDWRSKNWNKQRYLNENTPKLEYPNDDVNPDHLLNPTEYQIKSSNELILKRTEELKELNIHIKNITNIFYEMKFQNNSGRSISQRLISKFPSFYILRNSKINDIKNVFFNLKGYNSIKRNRLFDIGYYLNNNSDVRLSGVDPILHYMYHGFKEGRNPNPLFDSNFYLKRYNDVKQSNLNPLIHYSLFGIIEGRKTKTKTKIAIKIAASNWEHVHEWGDYHFALGLKKEFERKNWSVIIQIFPEWYDDSDSDCDLVIVLRGLKNYQTKNQHFNIMWNISHPDEIDIEEYNQYDHVLIASEVWARKLKKSVNVPVGAMLQCTDPELFYPEPSNDYRQELLFVGNSRMIFRKIIKDLLPTDKSLSVYGTNWDDFIDKKYIVGENIPNNELRKAYSSCKILLNDHWDDMREKGFISNRIFDGFASGAFIISDNVKGADEVFGDALITYETQDELNNLIDHYLNNEEIRIKKSEIVRSLILKHHTFKNRIDQFLEIIN